MTEVITQQNISTLDGVSAGGYSANYSDILNLAERFDPNTGAWVEIKSMPTPRGDVMCSALEGQFIVAGGYYDPTLKFIPANFRTEVEAYSPATGNTVCILYYTYP